MSPAHAYCGIHGGFYPINGACPNCHAGECQKPREISPGVVERVERSLVEHADLWQRLAEVDRTPDDVATRFSLQHALIMAHGAAIQYLHAAEDRQDAALTEVEAVVADLGALYDRIVQLERQVADLAGQLAQLLQPRPLT
jgi:hypothetical protein